MQHYGFAPSTQPYTLPFSGVITSWRTATEPSASVRLKLVRGNPAIVTGESGVEVSKSGAVSEFSTRIKAIAGDQLALRATGADRCTVPGTEDDYVGFSSLLIGGPPDYDTDSSDPPVGGHMIGGNSYMGVRLNISATLESDADQDGFGDASQDQCPTNALIQTSCNPPAQASKPLAIDAGQISSAVKGRQITVTASLSESGTLSASGSIAVGNTSRRYKLRSTSRRAAAGEIVRLKLRMSKRAQRAMLRKFARTGKGSRATIVLTGKSDSGGDPTTLTLRRRPKPTP